MKYLFYILTSFLVLSACCEKDCCEPPPSNYLIFGHYYGFCQGETCIEIFKLQDSLLLEDTLDKYPNSKNFYKGKYVLLPNDKYEIAKELLTDFPANLLNESQGVFGNPDAGDWGGVYLEYHVDDIHKSWLFDTQLDSLPLAYRDYIQQIINTTLELQ